jgi:hypothetical protein
MKPFYFLGMLALFLTNSAFGNEASIRAEMAKNSPIQRSSASAKRRILDYMKSLSTTNWFIPTKK